MTDTDRTPRAPESTGGPGLEPRAVAAVAVTLVLWASAFVAIRYLGPHFSPGSLSLGRLVVAATLLAAVCVARGVVAPTRAEWLRIATIGVLWYAVYNVALNAGEHLVDAGTAAMLLQVSPILIAVLAALFLGERFTTRLALGLGLAFAGVTLIALAGSHQAPGAVATSPRETATGAALCLLAALVYSISVIVQKPLMERIPAVQVTWLAATVGAIACLPFAGDLIHDVRAAPTTATLWVVYLGVFPTAIAFTTYAYALKHMSASSLGVTTYLVPPITIVLGAVFLAELPAPLAAVGGVLALAGVAVARRAPARSGRR